MTADEAPYNNESIGGANLESYSQPKRQKGVGALGRTRFNSLSSAIMDIAKIENMGNTNAARSLGSVEHLRPVQVSTHFVELYVKYM